MFNAYKWQKIYIYIQNENAFKQWLLAFHFQQCIIIDISRKGLEP